MSITKPTDIPGCMLWLSADHAAETLNDGDFIPVWVNLAGGPNATGKAYVGTTDKPILKKTLGKAGGPAVQFSKAANTFFEFPSGAFGTATAAEILFVLKTGNNSQVGFNDFGTSASSSHFPYDGMGYDDFASDGRKDGIGPIALNTWYNYRARSKSGRWTAWLNNSQVYDNASNTVAWNPTPVLGTTNQGWTFEGLYGCVVMYNRELTTAERTDLEAWATANPSGGTTTVPPSTYQVGAAIVENAETGDRAQVGAATTETMYQGPLRYNGGHTVETAYGGFERMVGHALVETLVLEREPLKTVVGNPVQRKKNGLWDSIWLHGTKGY